MDEARTPLPAVPDALPGAPVEDRPRRAAPTLAEQPVLVAPSTGAEAAAEVPPAQRRRWLWAVALVLASAVLGFALADAPAPGPPAASSSDLLLLLAAATPGTPAPVTSDAAARAYLREQAGLSVRPPALDGFALDGVGVLDATGAVPVPFFSMAQDGQPFPVYALTYAYLDEAADRVRLARPILNRIASGEAYVQPLGDTTGLVWRDRATIYLAFVEGSPQPLLDALP